MLNEEKAEQIRADYLAARAPDEQLICALAERYGLRRLQVLDYVHRGRVPGRPALRAARRARRKNRTTKLHYEPRGALGQFMASWRKEHAHTRTDASRMAGISCTTWGLLESGQRRPTLPTLEAIARAMECPIDELKTRAPALVLGGFQEGWVYEPAGPIGPLLQAFRRRRNLSYLGAAKLAGIAEHTWVAIETGFTARPQARTVERLARAMGMKTKQLQARITGEFWEWSGDGGRERTRKEVAA